MMHRATACFVLLCCLLTIHGSDIVSKAMSPAVTVSGISAGAFFATQFTVAFSGSVTGAGLVAGGPFFCAQNSVDTALTACMTSPDLIDVSILNDDLNFCVTSMTCDPPNTLANSRVWLFSGSADTIVHPGVVKKNENFFRLFMPEGSVKAVYTIPAEHSWVTSNYGSNCSYLGSPYLNACNYNAAFEMLNFIYNGLTPPPPNTVAPVQNLISLSQGKFAPDAPSALSLFDTAYAYVATGCQQSTNGCRLHVAFHGCEQTIPDIGMAFVNHSGLNEVAEVNNLIILYPQAIKSNLIPFNPKGCFDWWGYTGADYASKIGPQMITVDKMRYFLANQVSMQEMLHNGAKQAF